jgi:hypothetical protein
MALKELGDCPPIQDISNFIDGLVDGEEKKLLIGHFDECPICYETLSSTLDTQEEFPNLLEEKKPADILEFKPIRGPQFLNNFRFSQKKLAFLAAASVAGIIGFQILQPQFALNSPPSAFSVAQVINTEIQTLAARPQYISGTLMSARKPKKEDLFFHLGRRLTHIEVNLHQNNRKNLKEDLEILNEMEVMPQIRNPFEEFSKELSSLIASENNLMTKAGITENLIEKIKDSEEINHLRLGSWLEGIKIGLRSQPPLVPEIKSSEFFVDQLSEEKTKPKLIEELNALHQLLSVAGNKDDTNDLIDALNNVMVLY